MLSQITLFRVTRVPKQCTGNFKVSNAWTNLWNIMMEEKTGLKIQVGNAEIEHSGEFDTDPNQPNCFGAKKAFTTRWSGGRLQV